MKLIDKLFEKELKKQNIAFEEQYWQNMALLLDKKERRKAIYKRAKYLAIILLLMMPFVFAAHYFSIDAIQSSQTIQKQNINKSNVSKDNTNSRPNKNELSNQKHQMNERTDGNFSSNTSFKEMKIVLNKQIDKTVSDDSFQVIQRIPEVINEDKYVELIVDKSIEGDDFLLKMIGFKMFENKWFFDPMFSKENHMEIKVVKRVKWKYFVAPTIALDQNIKPEFNLPALMLNKNTESFNNTFSYGANVFMKKKNMVLGSGLGLMSYRFNTNYITDLKVLSFDTTLRMINPDFNQTPRGTKIALLSEDVDTSITYSQQQINPGNKAIFNYIQIPLFLRYERTFNQLSVFAETGMNTRLLLNKKGQYLIKQNQEFEVVDVKNSKDFKPLIFTYQFSVGLKYNISRKTSLVAAISHNRAINSMLDSYQQKVNQNSFRIGIEFGLFK